MGGAVLLQKSVGHGLQLRPQCAICGAVVTGVHQVGQRRFFRRRQFSPGQIAADSGPRDGDIQETERFRHLLFGHPGHMALDLGGSQIQNTSAALIGRMEQGRWVKRRQSLPHEGTKNNGEFKPLAFVNRQDGDGVIITFQAGLMGIGRVVGLQALHVQPLDEFAHSQTAFDRYLVHQFGQMQNIGDIAFSVGTFKQAPPRFVP